MKKVKKTANELLNLYMSSGGSKASYDDVALAVEAERNDRLKAEYGRIIGNLLIGLKKVNNLLDQVE